MAFLGSVAAVAPGRARGPDPSGPCGRPSSVGPMPPWQVGHENIVRSWGACPIIATRTVSPQRRHGRPERAWTYSAVPARVLPVLVGTGLRRARSIAMVGASDKPARASYFVATYLLFSTTYRVYFVNPLLAEAGKTILGQPVYA